MYSVYTMWYFMVDEEFLQHLTKRYWIQLLDQQCCCINLRISIIVTSISTIVSIMVISIMRQNSLSSEANSLLPLKSVDNYAENLADKRDAGQWLKYEAIRGKRIVH